MRPRRWRKSDRTSRPRLRPPPVLLRESIARFVNCLPLIEAKRDGGVLSAEEIQRVISSFTRGDIPDYQMAALLMAIYFRGLNADETRALTLAMRDSGDALSFARDPARP